MFCTAALLMTLITSTCPNGQCPVPYYSPTYDSPPVVQTAPPDAVVRVINHGQNGGSLGSGTVVASEADQAIVLTCAHLFSDGVGRLSVRFSNGLTTGARLVAVDRRWDLAALAIQPTTAIHPPPIAAEAPTQGESLTSCGYGPDGRFLINRGTVRGYVRAAGTTAFETLEMTGAARQGDSGGPILNRAGELVAVLWGSDGQTVSGTYCGRIRRFLAQVLNALNPSPVVGSQQIAPTFPAIPTVPSQNLPLPNASEGDTSGEKETLAERLVQLNQGIATFRTRLESVADRLQRIEAVSAKIQNLGLLDGSVATNAWLPAVMAALGWTTPPSLALLLGLRLGSKVLRRRIRKRREGNATTANAPAKPNATVNATEATTGSTENQSTTSNTQTISDDYGRQLAQVYALSGRSPIGDVTLGREYDEELRKAEISSDGQLANWAGALRRRVAERFNRIHNSSTTPADPIEG